MISLHDEVPLKNQLKESWYFLLLHLFRENELLKAKREENAREVAEFLKKNKRPFEEIEIPRISNLSKKEFIAHYYKKNLPVIFDKEALNWDCTRKWCLEYLHKISPQAELEVLESIGLFDKEDFLYKGVDCPYKLQKMTAKQVLDEAKKGRQPNIKFTQVLDIVPTLKNDINVDWLKKMGHSYLGDGFQTFIGPANKKTPIHSAISSFFYIMVKGQKKWSMFSFSSNALIRPDINYRVYNFSDVNIKNPDPSSYYGFEYLTRYTCTLEEGDILYCPSWMYHEVENLEQSWGTNFRFNALRPMMKYPMHFFMRFTVSRPNVFSVLFERLGLSKDCEVGSQVLK